MLGLHALGCDGSRPWERAHETAGANALTPPADAAAPLRFEEGDASSDDLDRPRAWPPLWASCHGGFRLGGDPVKDVTRLSLLCGPRTGMVRASKQPIEGTAEEGAAGPSGAFEAAKGDCYRIFATAEPTVTDLEVTVQSSRDAVVARDHDEASWAIAQMDRPFCTSEADTFTVRIGSKRGSGRVAAEIWRLDAASLPP